MKRGPIGKYASGKMGPLKWVVVGGGGLAVNKLSSNSNSTLLVPHTHDYKLEEADRKWLTLLQRAAMRGHCEYAKLLIIFGAFPSRFGGT